MKNNLFGKIVNVNNHNIHIYSEGSGTPTLVFMSGGSTYFPVIDFYKLFSKMSNEFKIVVVERAGYGFSEISNVSRDIDTVLFETRTVLKETNINPPYILFPHSMAGIEALYWIQNFPNEIKCIIGLDPALPIFYEIMNLKQIYKIMKFLSKIFPKRITNDMVNEVKIIRENARKINKESLTNFPFLFFISNGKGTGFNRIEWERSFKEYCKDLNVKIIELKGSHYLHKYFPENISNISKTFIKENIN